MRRQKKNIREKKQNVSNSLPKACCYTDFVSPNSVVLKPGYHQNYIGSFIGLLVLNYFIKSSDLFKSSKIPNP